MQLPQGQWMNIGQFSKIHYIMNPKSYNVWHILYLICDEISPAFFAVTFLEWENLVTVYIITLTVYLKVEFPDNTADIRIWAALWQGYVIHRSDNYGTLSALANTTDYSDITVRIKGHSFWKFWYPSFAKTNIFHYYLLGNFKYYKRFISDVIHWIWTSTT